MTREVHDRKRAHFPNASVVAKKVFKWLGGYAISTCLGNRLRGHKAKILWIKGDIIRLDARPL